MRRALLLILASCLLFAAPVAADTGQQSATVSAQPNQAGRASNLLLSASGSAGGLGQSAPQGVTISLFKGFAVDPGAVAGRCVDPASCPASSAAAHGTFQGRAVIFGTNQSFSGTIDAFLAAPTGSAVADVIVQFKTSGQTRTGRGQLVAVNDRAYGYELRFDPLPQVSLPPGATASIDSLSLTTGASRTVTTTSTRRKSARRKKAACRRNRRGCRHRRHKKAHRAATATRSLLTNPATCSTGGWPLELRVRYSDHTDVRSLTIACAP